VGGVERVGNFNCKRQQHFNFQRTPGDTVLQSCTIQKLHRDKCLAVLLANVVNRANVGVVQCGCGLCLALKTGKHLRVTGNIFWQEFEGNEAM